MIRILLTVVVYLISQLSYSQTEIEQDIEKKVSLIVENKNKEDLNLLNGVVAFDSNNGVSLTNGQVMYSKTYTISVKVANVNGTEGEVMFALYDSKENFAQQKPILSKSGKIVKGTSSVVFEDIESGEYAIVCLHDKNSNGRMDFSLNGMPLEDYGSSNNKMRIGPPNFEDAKFTVENKSLDLTIRF